MSSISLLAKPWGAIAEVNPDGAVAVMALNHADESATVRIADAGQSAEVHVPAHAL